EGEPKRYEDLVKNLAAFPHARAVCKYVEPDGEDSLDNVLADNGVGPEVDLLSIDVDGDDYHIWRGLTRCRPRVVVIEYNPTIPPGLALVQRRGEYFGASAAALVSLAHSKGYGLACCTKTNCIFVDERDWNALGIEQPSLENVFPRGHLTYVVNAYDGRTFLTRTPTYTSDLATLTPGVLVRELRASLKAAEHQGPCDAQGQHLQAVKMFLVPLAPSGSLARRAIRYVWRTVIGTRFGRPLQDLREK